MKKESVSWGMVKQMICGVKAMVKRKTRALKARLIIHSLLSHTNFLVSSVAQHQHRHQHQHCELRARVEEHQEAEAEAETEAEARVCEEGRSGRSVIEMVKHSKEEAGEEFSLEQDIDHVADLFIRNFHQQMRMQKQHSLKRYQDMLLIDGAL